MCGPPRGRRSPLEDRRRRDVRQLFRPVLRCVRAGRAKPIIRPSEQIAAHSYAAGIDLAEVQESFTVLAEVLWRQLAGTLAGEQLVQALGLLTDITGAGKDAMARTYVALAARYPDGEEPSDEPAAAGAGPGDRAERVVQTKVVGRVVRGFRSAAPAGCGAWIAPANRPALWGLRPWTPSSLTQMVTTTLPGTCPCSWYLTASAMSWNGYVRLMTGVILPSSMSVVSVVRICFFAVHETVSAKAIR